MTIRLHIDELVLEGFPPNHRDRIAAAVQDTLTGLFTEHGVPPGLADGGQFPRLDAGTFAIAPGARPEAIGARIAQSLFGGLKR